MKYFIDTNIIIDLLDGDKKAVELIVRIANDKDSKLFINRLVCIEALRTIHFDNSRIFNQAKESLESFEKLEINPKIYEKAINFSRYCHSKGVKLKGKCEAIDFLHFVTAKYYDLEIVSNDKDLNRLEDVYKKYMM